MQLCIVNRCALRVSWHVTGITLELGVLRHVKHVSHRSAVSEVQAINTYEKTDIKCYRNVMSVLLLCYYFSVVQDFISDFGHVDIWLWVSGLEGRLPLQSSINWLYQRLYATVLAS